MARPRKFDEHEVLLAARAQFWHQGYEGTSMAELCAATGVASQSLYGAFGSKHELFLRTLGDYCVQQVAGLEAAYAAAPSPWSWLLAAVAFEDGGRIGLTSDGCYLSNSTAALSRLDAEVETASRRTYQRIHELFTTAVAAAQESGELRADAEPSQVALAMIAAMQGIEFLSKSGLDEAAFADTRSAVLNGLRLAYAAPGSNANADADVANGAPA